MKRFNHWLGTAPILQFYSFLLGAFALAVLIRLLTV
jgi:hypothetical protein